tara:strand:+ start:325 stop:1338 length:1014 start_codon:yes stop_codon:yes gene_type:complete
MATNFHSTLPNDQIHLPKDFSVASESSVMHKDENKQLKWAASQFDLSTQITCANDVAGNLHNTSFVIYYTNSNIVEFSIDVTGSSGSYTPLYPTYTQVSATIAANDTAATIATAIKTAIDNLSASDPNFDFTVVVVGSQLTITGMSNCPNAFDETTSFTFATTKTFYGQQVLQADTDGSISFKGIPFEREFQISALPTLNNTNIWLQKPGTNVGNMGVDSSVAFPTTAIAIRQALGGAVYHASKGDSFGYWRGVIGGIATFNIGLLRVKNDCTHATPNNGDIITSQSFHLTDPDWGVCFNLTASFDFEESDLIVPIVYGTTLAGAWYGTTRIKINRI